MNRLGFWAVSACLAIIALLCWALIQKSKQLETAESHLANSASTHLLIARLLEDGDTNEAIVEVNQSINNSISYFIESNGDCAPGASVVIIANEVSPEIIPEETRESAEFRDFLKMWQP